MSKLIRWGISLLKKYRELVMYGIVGVMTTVINMVVFWIFTAPLPIHYTLANIIAWVLAVVFAFFANKIFVFENHGWSGSVVLHEAITFFLSRIASLAVDMLGMALMISVLHCEEMLSKFLVNILVILVNYILGKFWVFSKKADEPLAKEGSDTP